MPPKASTTKSVQPKTTGSKSNGTKTSGKSQVGSRTTTPQLQKSTITYISTPVSKDKDGGSASSKQSHKLAETKHSLSGPKKVSMASANPTRAPGKQAQLPDGRYIVYDGTSQAYVRNAPKPGVQRQSGGVSFKIGSKKNS